MPCSWSARRNHQPVAAVTIAPNATVAQKRTPARAGARANASSATGNNTTTDAFVGYLENHARGAAYPAVVAADFERAEILVPPNRLLELFDEFRPAIGITTVVQCIDADENITRVNCLSPSQGIAKKNHVPCRDVGDWDLARDVGIAAIFRNINGIR